MMKSVLDDRWPEPRPQMWQKFGIEGIVYKEFVPPWQMVNGKFYCKVLRWLRENIWCECLRQVAQQLLGPASWQCSGSRVTHCAAVFGFYEDESLPPPFLLTGPCPLWFLPIPEDEIEVLFFGPCIFIIEERTDQRNAQINFSLINLLLFKLLRHVSAT